MIRKTLIAALLLIPALFPVTPAFSQEPDAEQETSQEANRGSQEVEYNDDNYRRFMELKDQPTESSTLPTNAYQPGTQKLDELPEASQKHLRNQLREIILEGDEWAPGDENKKFPYVASEAAQKDPDLRQQEAEAWNELVGKYHEREAQIYANSARSASAAGAKDGPRDASQALANTGRSAGGSGASNNSNTGQSGKGDQNQDGQNQDGQNQSGQKSQSAGNPGEGSAAPSSVSAASMNDPDAASASGVSQSALEYLESTNKLVNGSQGSPGESPSKATQAEQGMEQVSLESGSPDSGKQADAAATKTQPGEFVVISKDTLSIKDLKNAQGVTISKGTSPSRDTPVDNEEGPDKEPHKNDNM